MKLFKRRPEKAAPPNVDPTAQNLSDQPIEGDRGTPSVSRETSTQARLSNALAIALMGILGVGILTWYYTRTYSQSGKAREQVSADTRRRAQGEVTLPPLGPIELPAAQTGVAEGLLGPAPEAPPPDDIPAAWLEPAKDAPTAPVPYGPPVKSAQELALERKLSGPVGVTGSANQIPAATLIASTSVEEGEEGLAAGSVEPMNGMLKASVTPAARARVLPTQRLLLPKGAFLDCTLETAMDSTLPGMVTCVTATDTFGVDGSVVLMERGTKLIGETRGQVQQGSARIFVLWSEARTPTGVVIPLASPGTDELGRSGLPGKVNRHFWDRFGAAILISVIDGAIQREVQRQSDASDGTVIYNPSTSQDVMTEVLKSTVNIPPTVTKHNGDRIQVLVARDLDFRSVYELRPAGR